VKKTLIYAPRRCGGATWLRANDDRAAKAEAILGGRSIPGERGMPALSQREWSKYDPISKGYTAEEIRQERERYLRR
jgi:hypothetical protein